MGLTLSGEALRWEGTGLVKVNVGIHFPVFTGRCNHIHLAGHFLPGTLFSYSTPDTHTHGYTCMHAYTHTLTHRHTQDGGFRHVITNIRALRHQVGPPHMNM